MSELPAHAQLEQRNSLPLVGKGARVWVGKGQPFVRLWCFALSTQLSVERMATARSGKAAESSCCPEAGQGFNPAVRRDGR